MAQENIYYCIGCNKTHPKGEFYMSFNPTHQNKVYPFCKKYIKDYVYEGNDVNLDKLKELLMQMNAPFLEVAWEAAVADKKETIGMYIKNINMRQNRGLTWEDSTADIEDYNTDDEDKTYKYEPQSDNFEVTQEILHRWGSGYTKEQLRDLEKFYNDMVMTHTIETPQHKKALAMMCKMQIKMDLFLEENDMVSFSKLHGEYQKLLTSSGLRPIDKVSGDEATGLRSFSQIFEEVERDGFVNPTPIKENQDIIDRTIQYIMNYTLKLLNQQVLTEPPCDTPKVDDDNE